MELMELTIQTNKLFFVSSYNLYLDPFFVYIAPIHGTKLLTCRFYDCNTRVYAWSVKCRIDI